LASGALDEKSFDELCAALERKAEAADTVSELCSAYRDVVRDMDEALQRPVEAHQERSLRRAVSFIRDHISEPLSLNTVARHAGFAPNYFSRLFKQREKVTFELYVRDLRIERAKEMLARTSLSVERVGQLSGFASNHYFHRVFKRVTAETPRECRNRLQRELRADLPPAGRAAHQA
jgi:YesN/AraC family two-component response regulator